MCNSIYRSVYQYGKISMIRTKKWYCMKLIRNKNPILRLCPFYYYIKMYIINILIMDHFERHLIHIQTIICILEYLRWLYYVCRQPSVPYSPFLSSFLSLFFSSSLKNQYFSHFLGILYIYIYIIGYILIILGTVALFSGRSQPTPPA
jgi:hypothetical protein